MHVVEMGYFMPEQDEIAKVHVIRRKLSQDWYGKILSEGPDFKGFLN